MPLIRDTMSSSDLISSVDSLISSQISREQPTVKSNRISSYMWIAYQTGNISQKPFLYIYIYKFMWAKPRGIHFDLFSNQQFYCPFNNPHGYPQCVLRKLLIRPTWVLFISFVRVFLHLHSQSRGTRLEIITCSTCTYIYDIHIT